MAYSLTNSWDTTVGLCEKADLVVGLGSKSAEKLTADLCHLKKQVVNLTPGIFSELMDLNHVEGDATEFRILFLNGKKSTEFFRDRVNIAAKAISLVKDKTLRLVVTGVDEEKRTEFQKNWCECEAAKQQLIIYQDFPVCQPDLKRLFCDVDLAMLLSADDECGLMALCAVSVGLPLYVCGDSAFAASLRVVPFGRASTVDDAENAEKWADSIKMAKETAKKLRLEQAEKLRSNFEEKHSWKTQIESLVGQMLKMFQGDSVEQTN